jgi:hypothetical protein
MEFADADSMPPLCQTEDGRILPYSDIGLGYAAAPDNGPGFPGVGGGVGQAVSQTAMPTEPKLGGLGGGGPSGPWTSPASVVLRDVTNSAHFGPLRSITGKTASVGGAIGRALPFVGAALTLEDYLKMQDAMDNAQSCKPVA